MKFVQSDGNVVHNIFTKQIVSHNLWSGNRKAFRNIVLVVVVNVLSLIQVVFMRQNYHFSFDRPSSMLLIDLLQNEKQIKPFYCEIIKLDVFEIIIEFWMVIRKQLIFMV